MCSNSSSSSTKFKAIDEENPLNCQVKIRVSRRLKERLVLLPGFSSEVRKLINEMLIKRGL